MKVLAHLLAQATQPATGPAPSPPSMWKTFLPLMLMIGVFYWIVMRGSRKQRRQQQEMLAAIKRNDRVQTIGGIIGTVVDVRDQEVVLKVDETSNVKMRFNRGAIKEVLRETPPSEATKS